MRTTGTGEQDTTRTATRPGGRSERVRRAVLAAAADELLDVGFERLSIAGVARRAGVHHTTIYRRWETKSRLVLDAIAELTRERVTVPDLGSLREDLRAYFAAMIGAFGEPRVAALVRGLIAIPPDEFPRERRAYWQERFDVAGEIVARAEARGELPAGADPWRLIELVAGPLWMRALMTGLPVDAPFLDRAVDDALRAVGAPSR
jgi:AcrR family transcriptional regulator